jgi:hypothetical protein
VRSFACEAYSDPAGNPSKPRLRRGEEKQKIRRSEGCWNKTF